MFRGRRRLPRRLGITVMGATVLALGVLVAPAVASAKAKTPISVEVGPITTAKGYTFDLFAGTCKGAKSSISITYSKGPESDNIEYEYDGTGTCTAKSRTRATLAVNWPKIAKLKLAVGSVLKSRAAVTPKGCTGGKGTSEAVLLTGRIGVIPSKALGQVHGSRIRGYISQISGLNCKTPSAPKATNFFGEFGANSFVNAEQPTRGSRGVFLSKGFTPAKGVTGSMFLSLTGKAKLFNVTSAGVATLTNVKPFAAGKLVMTELPLCINSTETAHNVTVSGQLTVKSPVLGTVIFGPSTVTGGWIGIGSAIPDGCNGYGSVALTPAIDNVCSTDGFCSISEGTNTAEFDDVSDPGTQTIVSETINFGDGSPDASFTNGSVSHAYATAGNYTATITIETSNGQTQTEATPVYIDA